MYSVTDLTELVRRHHLVLPTDITEEVDIQLAQLIRNIEQMIATPYWHEPTYWMACEDRGAWVSSELLGPARRRGRSRRWDARRPHLSANRRP